MNILAIDTVFNKCGVAIMIEGDIAYQDEQLGKRQQTQQILPMIDSALKSTGLRLKDFSALVFNRGPGAFSGIRINTAVIQALSVACDIPCVGISSLQILAQAGRQADRSIEHCYAVLDARMSQVYLGEFELQNGLMQAVNHVDGQTENEGLLDYQLSTAKNSPLITFVDDDQDLLTLHADQQGYQITVDASILAELGAEKFKREGGVPAEQALPIYLRNHAWKTLKEQGKKTI